MAKGFKTGGRQQGQPNKLTRELRAMLGEIVKKEIEKLPELLKELEPKDRAVILEKFTGYVLPKNLIENEEEDSERIIIQMHANL